MNTELVTLAKQTASSLGLDGVLVCAIIEQESSWSPHAVRLENGFYHAYMSPWVEQGKVTVSDAVLRSTSFGLMQTMLESLREMAFAGTPEDLIVPTTGIEWGCHLFNKKLAASGGDITRALQAWNGGGNPNYAAEVLAREAHY
jgi:soluble lytic murein transglycosylase-like protein